VSRILSVVWYKCSLPTLTPCSRCPDCLWRQARGRGVDHPDLDLGQDHRVRDQVCDHIHRQGRAAPDDPRDIGGEPGHVGSSFHHLFEVEALRGSGGSEGSLARCLFLGPSPHAHGPLISHPHDEPTDRFFPLFSVQYTEFSRLWLCSADTKCEEMYPSSNSFVRILAWKASNRYPLQNNENCMYGDR